MVRLCTFVLCLAITGCLPGPDDTIRKAIAASNNGDLETFLENLDTASAALVKRAGSGTDIPADWQWLDGTPEYLLKGATIVGKTEVSDNAVRYTINAPSSEIKKLWVLKSDDGPVPTWSIHLPGSQGLFSPMMVVKP